MTPVFLNVLLDRDITEPASAELFAAAILDTVPDVFPQRVGNFEPVRQPCSSIADLRRQWAWPVLGTRRQPRSELSVWFRRSHRRYTAIAVSVYDTAFTASSLAPLLARIARDFDAAYGMVQAVSPAYRCRADQLGILSYTDRARKRFFISLSDESVADGVPDAFDFNWLPPRLWIAPQDATRCDGLLALQDGSDEERNQLKHEIRNVG